MGTIQSSDDEDNSFSGAVGIQSRILMVQTRSMEFSRYSGSGVQEFGRLYEEVTMGGSRVQARRSVQFGRLHVPPREPSLLAIEPLSKALYYDDKTGCLRCRTTDCMIIASFGSELPSGVHVAKKLKPGGTFLYGVREDLNKIQALIRQDKSKDLHYVHTDYPGIQRSKMEYLNNIESLMENSQAEAGQIWYTGHGERHTGNWVFKDGVITFKEILRLYLEHFRHKLLTLVCDCCYAGRWIQECAKELDRMGIAACGHKAKEAGVLLKVFTSCSSSESAYDTYYTCHGGVVLFEESIGFHGDKMICPESGSGKSQTTASGDFTKISCFKEPHQPCSFPALPAALQWRWQDLTRRSYRDQVGNRLYLVRVKDRGSPAWHYVLVYDHLRESFKRVVASGTVDVALYGHVLAGGWGSDPPKDIKDRITSKSAPFTVVRGCD